MNTVVAYFTNLFYRLVWANSETHSPRPFFYWFRIFFNASLSKRTTLDDDKAAADGFSFSKRAKEKDYVERETFPVSESREGKSVEISFSSENSGKTNIRKLSKSRGLKMILLPYSLFIFPFNLLTLSFTFFVRAIFLHGLSMGWALFTVNVPR